MAKSATTFKLDGKTYTVNPYDANDGLNLLTELFLLLGEGVVRLALSMKDGLKPGQSVLDADIDMDKVNASIGALAAKLSPEKFNEIVKKILDQTLVDTTSVSVVDDFGQRFMGDYLHLFKLTWKTLEVQYGDFLGALGGLGKAFGMKAQSSRQNTAKSTQT